MARVTAATSPVGSPRDQTTWSPPLQRGKIMLNKIAACVNVPGLEWFHQNREAVVAHGLDLISHTHLSQLFSPCCLLSTFCRSLHSPNFKSYPLRKKVIQQSTFETSPLQTSSHPHNSASPTREFNSFADSNRLRSCTFWCAVMVTKNEMSKICVDIKKIPKVPGASNPAGPLGLAVLQLDVRRVNQ